MYLHAHLHLLAFLQRTQQRHLGHTHHRNLPHHNPPVSLLLPLLQLVLLLVLQLSLLPVSLLLLVLGWLLLALLLVLQLSLPPVRLSIVAQVLLCGQTLSHRSIEAQS
jgi:hypothetical protein